MGASISTTSGRGRKRGTLICIISGRGRKTVGASAPTAPISSAPLIMLVTENIEFYEKLVVQFLALFARF